MEQIKNHTLVDRAEKCRLIQQNFQDFRTLVTQARNFVQRGKYDAAAVYAEMAACYATGKHCGLFNSPELEQVLITIEKKAIPTAIFSSSNTSQYKTPQNILHVSTVVMPTGGHSRMIWRWMQQDAKRSHSLALTRQSLIEIPKILRDTVSESRGKIHILDKRDSSIISRSKRLQELASKADLIVLHIHNYDVIPILAFANQDKSPPILFLNHSDHVFWLGVNISNAIVNLRVSGMKLSQKRRGIQTERNVLLPTILEPTHRILSRLEAKQNLGLPENSIVLLSIARAPKYKTIGGISFADTHLPLLERYKQVILIVVGPGNQEDWSTAIQKAQGRLIVHTEREDTAVFYQAADIYIDSFPFVSTTSLLEAGSYGVPLVSRFPHSSVSDILGADMPGLTGNLIHVKDTEAYIKVLSRLIEDEEYRLSLGEVTGRKIQDTHWGSNWQDRLEEVYCAATLPRTNVTEAPMDQMFLGEPDILLQDICGWEIDLDSMVQSYMRIMPIGQRLIHLPRLIRKYGFHGQFSFLLPEWFYLQHYQGLRASLKL